MYDLGNLLKQLREEKEISMDKMIEDMKNLYNVSIAKSTISKWENNKADPSMEYARILTKYFNISLDYLLGLSKYRNKEEELQNYKNKMTSFYNDDNKDSHESKLINSFNKLNDLGKKKVIDYTKDLSDNIKYLKDFTQYDSNDKKEIWETEGNEYLMPIASHDDNLTNEEKYIMDKRINEVLKNLNK